MIGTIVYCKYLDFDKEISHGLFLVIYDENDDVNTDNKYNICAVKITSKDRNKDIYSTLLHCDCLNFTSYAMCSKIHTFRTYDNVISILGKVSNEDMKNVYEHICNFMYETLIEIGKYIENE